MMPMFLTVYLSNNDQHFTEVPVTPETLCRDVVELCKEPGEGECYLLEIWRGAERAMADGERMLEVLQRWGQQRGELRFLLRHERAPGPNAGGSRVSDNVGKRNVMKSSVDRRPDNGVSAPGMDVTLADLQDMAARQQQQINSQQQLLVSKEQRLRSLKQQEQRRQQQSSVSEQDKLRQLRENAHNQEAKLRRVRALRGQVEEKRLTNSKLVEEIEQMTGLFQDKQRELLVAVSRVEDLSQQLEALKRSGPDPTHHGPSSASELERLCKELQLRNKLNAEQSGRLQQQRDSLSRRNLEVAAMDRRVAELRQRLWKKKAALQHKDTQPVVSDGLGPQQSGASRVAAVGPYIQAPPSDIPPTGPPVPNRQERLKAAYPDGTATLPMPDSSAKPPPRPLKASSDGGITKDQKGWPVADAPPPIPPRTNQGIDDIIRDTQGKLLSKLLPPPVLSKPRLPSHPTGTFPGKARLATPHPRPPPPGHTATLPLPLKADAPPAAAVPPFSPDPPEGPAPVLQKPQTLAASSIYSMYTQQSCPGKGYAPPTQGTLPRTQPRVYGKPVLPSSGGQQPSVPDGAALAERGCEAGEGEQGVGDGAEPGERVVPRPLSPTKLLPFISQPQRSFNAHSPCDLDLEALRRRLQHAPRPLKKRSSITEPEGPQGPNIQKLLYQKTTLAAMETGPMETPAFQSPGGGLGAEPPVRNQGWGGAFNPVLCEGEEDNGQTPPPLPPRSPIADPASCRSPAPPLEEEEEEEEEEEVLAAPVHMDEYPPYPPPPYPSTTEQDLEEDGLSMQPPEVTGEVTLPPGKRTNLRKVGSGRIQHRMRVQFNPLALLLDCSLEGEYDLVQRVIYDVEDPSLPNDEGITALHNAVCAGHTDIVKFLVQFGVNVNAADSDGWTPLHCAASCNNVQVCKFLVESGAAVFATTYSDQQTAADKCEEMEEGYAQCSQFLYGVQEKMGVMNRGVVYALWDHEALEEDELAFVEGDCMTVLRREDKYETEWWWTRCADGEGYIPRNLLGLYLRIKPRQRSLA